MDTPFLYILIGIAGCISAYFGMYIAGGISSIALGSLLALGLPPTLANSTYQIGNIGSNLGGLSHFIRSHNYVKKYIVPMFFLMFLGGFCGSFFLLKIETLLIYKVTGIILLLLCLISFLDKNQGIHAFYPSKKQKYIGYILIFVASFWSGIFPAGNGVFFYQIYTRYFGMTALQAKGHQKIVLFGYLLGVLPMMMIHSSYILSYGIAFFIGMYIGGYLGSKHVIHLGNQLLRKTLLVGMMSLGVYFLFFIR